MGLFKNNQEQGPKRPGFLSRLISGILVGREIEKRVHEDFPSWEEFSEQKLHDTESSRQPLKQLELPRHKIYLTSPLHGNLMYMLVVAVTLMIGYETRDLAPVLIYGAIGVAAGLALIMLFLDGLFFHLETLRLHDDSEMINTHTEGPDLQESGSGIFSKFLRKTPDSRLFRSKLFQIHYQNVLRTFEQGNRRAWVSQDASITDIHTLLTQRGMKLAWTVIDVLPLLGLLGTLLGLMHMFVAFGKDVENPELTLLSGFGTALGTTIMANLFVLILRPLYMRNERSMNEILNTMQMLMAMFILPTQQSVLDRMHGSGARGQQMAYQGFYGHGQPDTRITQAVDDLTRSLNDFLEFQMKLGGGSMAKETAQVAKEVRELLHSFSDSVDLSRLEGQQKSMDRFAESVNMLAQSLEEMKSTLVTQGGISNQRIEHDLTQLRVLNHDTLLLLDQIAGHMSRLSQEKKDMLSANPKLREQVFKDQTAPGAGRPRAGTSGMQKPGEKTGKSSLYENK
ncbi:MAG: MotA/TolQ/ExbB proton channel family protein [Deltaproteobacteria bacterium]|nr:MotA/TolQ/ExbB proton channel family protein [Deltaproteobacteria bacterium]